MKRKHNNEDESNSFISSGTVKELQTIASVFIIMKEFSTNPLNTAIERKVGDVVSEVVAKAFNQSQVQKKSIIDKIFDSQFAMSYGMGIGSRTPELIKELRKPTQ